MHSNFAGPEKAIHWCVNIKNLISIFLRPNEYSFSELCRRMLEDHLMSDWAQERRDISNNEQFKTLEWEFLAEALKIADLDIHVIPAI